VWQQNEAIAVYSAAAVSAHPGRGPTAAVASWLNQPVFVEVFNTTDSGGSLFQYDAGSATDSFAVDMARHAHGATAGPIDTFGLETTAYNEAGNCSVYGWASRLM
jgi:hypothetical protein